MRPNMIDHGVAEYSEKHLIDLYGEETYRAMVKEKKKRDRIKKAEMKRLKELLKIPMRLDENDDSPILDTRIFNNGKKSIGRRASHCVSNFINRKSEVLGRKMSVNMFVSHFPYLEAMVVQINNCGIQTALHIAEVLNDKYGIKMERRAKTYFYCPHCENAVKISELKTKLS